MFQKFDTKTKTLIPDHYNIIAVGERNHDSGEIKEGDNSGSFDEHENEEKSREVNRHIRNLEISHMYSDDNEIESSNPECITTILKELVEKAEF